MNDSQIVTGIDIGTTNVKCVIARQDPDSEDYPTIIGVGSVSVAGMRKGEVVNASEVTSAINESILMAQETAGVEVRSTTININGVHLVSLRNRRYWLLLQLGLEHH